MRNNSPNTIRNLSQIAGSQAELARTLGLTPEHVSRIARRRSKVPRYMEVIEDLLDAVPRKDWPSYWRKDEVEARKEARRK